MPNTTKRMFARGTKGRSPRGKRKELARRAILERIEAWRKHNSGTKRQNTLKRQEKKL